MTNRETDRPPTVEFPKAGGAVADPRYAAVLMRSAEFRLGLRGTYDIKGAMILPDCLDAALIDGLREDFAARHGKFYRDEEHPDALRVGDRRFMISPVLDGPWNDPALFANPVVLPVLRELLGPDCVLDNITVVLSLPGAAEQDRHRDHPGLFGADPIDQMLPPFAITMVLPLVDLTETNGTTRLYLGSHHVNDNDHGKFAAHDPLAARGSCFLMDYRLLHQGLANASDAARPLVYLVYSRPWFRDFVNFRGQAPLTFPEAELGKMAPEHRALIRGAPPDRSGGAQQAAP